MVAPFIIDWEEYIISCRKQMNDNLVVGNQCNIDNGLDERNLLQFALREGILDLTYVQEHMKMKEREELLAEHPYSKWYGTDNKWHTYFPDKKKGRVPRKRNTEEELDDLIVEFYKKKKEFINIKSIFREWSIKKLKQKEIQKQSYDRYCSDFKRFFPDESPINQKKIKDITELELEDFIKDTIVEKKLTQKTYAGFRLLIRGIFKYAKKKGETSIVINDFFEDLELSRNMFEHKLIHKEEEVFFEDEIPEVTKYLKKNPDIWNMGLLLEFQTGLRVGELSALKMTDFKKDFRKVRISRTEYKYQDENGTWKVGVKELAKTDAGNRDVVLPATAKDTIRQILLLNPDGEYLFMNNGKRIRGNTFNKRLTRLLDKLELQHRSTHKIRKTYGTTLLDSNVDEGFVAEQMGHASVETTRKLYYFSNKKFESHKKQIDFAIGF